MGPIGVGGVHIAFAAQNAEKKAVERNVGHNHRPIHGASQQFHLDVPGSE